MAKKQTNITAWVCRIIAAIIMLQTLYFKFTAAPESIYIFSSLGMEPWGRIGTGVLEGLASILLLIPRTTIFGAMLGLGLMSGALFFHFTQLGIVVQNDGGQLFIYALLVWLCCLLLLLICLPQLIRLLHRTKLRTS
ncbi:MAG: DoxX family protein [Citrobacter freundii]|nr:MAG: DoxX family protein [Citrobacter freundii]